MREEYKQNSKFKTKLNLCDKKDFIFFCKFQVQGKEDAKKRHEHETVSDR